MLQSIVNDLKWFWWSLHNLSQFSPKNRAALLACAGMIVGTAGMFIAAFFSTILTYVFFGILMVSLIVAAVYIVTTESYWKRK